MGGIRLRTKFLLSMVVVSAALTFTTLLVVRRTVQQEVRVGIQRDLDNSVSAFHDFQKQREVTLERSAALLADLPNVRALMTTHDPATIQDASRDLWQRVGGGDLLLLADSSGKVMALQGAPPEITVRQGQELLPALISREETRHWWYVEGHLYEVFLQAGAQGFRDGQFAAGINRVDPEAQLGFEELLIELQKVCARATPCDPCHTTLRVLRIGCARL